MSVEAADKDSDVKKTLEEYLRNLFSEREELSLIHLEKVRLGASHNIFMLTVNWKGLKGQTSENLVIRMEPDMGVHQSYDIGRECEAVKIMYKAGVPVPKIYCLEKDKRVLGNPFVLMEKIEGEKLMDAWMKQPECRPQFTKDFASILAKIHTMDQQEPDLAFLVEPDQERHYVEKEIEKWVKVLEDNQYSAYPVMAELVVWLKRNIPPLRAQKGLSW